MAEIQGGIDQSIDLNENTSTQKEKQDYKEQEWYNKLSESQKETIDEKFESKEKIEKAIEQKKAEIKFKGLNAEILSKGIERNINLIEDTEDKLEIRTFEERVDIINRYIDLLSRELYDLNLQLNSENLENKSKEANLYFKNNFLKEGETNEFILNLVESKDLKNITAGEIYSLKQEGYDLSQLFLIGGDKQVTKDTINIGDSFVVNFGGNKELNKFIGAGDLLPIDKIDKVIINGVEGERKLNPRPGYYSAEGKYLSVFDNYKIEIVSEKEFTGEEKEQSLLAFKNRFEEIRKPEVISNFRELLSENGENHSIDLDGFSKADLQIIVGYLTNNFSNENLGNINFDLEKGILSTKSGKSINEVINKFIPKESLGKGYEKYKDIVIEVANKYGIKPESLIILINHENARWDPLAGAPGSSAYGLGQMINSTWSVYGYGLDRNNPHDQLEATCRYLNKIKERQNCSDDLAMAYYNTGEGIMRISDSKAREFARLNPAISNKIPSSEYLDAKTYFIGAVAYYNDKTFSQAKNIVS